MPRSLRRIELHKAQRGKGIANPLVTILSVALIFDWLGQPAGAKMIRRAAKPSVTGNSTLKRHFKYQGKM
jgi:isocitrate/isopropylmalate dehydrogenase